MIHRVVTNGSEQEIDDDRYSLAVFYDPDSHAKLKPLTEFTKKDLTNKYHIDEYCKTFSEYAKY